MPQTVPIGKIRKYFLHLEASSGCGIAEFLFGVLFVALENPQLCSKICYVYLYIMRNNILLKSEPI